MYLGVICVCRRSSCVVRKGRWVDVDQVVLPDETNALYTMCCFTTPIQKETQIESVGLCVFYFQQNLCPDYFVSPAYRQQHCIVVSTLLYHVHALYQIYPVCRTVDMECGWTGFIIHHADKEFRLKCAALQFSEIQNPSKKLSNRGASSNVCVCVRFFRCKD